MGLPWWLSGKEPTCQCRRGGFHRWVGKVPWRRKQQPTPGFSPGESQTEEPGGLQSTGSQKSSLATKQQQQGRIRTKKKTFYSAAETVSHKLLIRCFSFNKANLQRVQLRNKSSFIRGYFYLPLTPSNTFTFCLLCFLSNRFCSKSG